MTKQAKQPIKPERDRLATKSGAPRIEVTPEMIEAGALELTASYGEETSDCVVVAIYEAMEEVRLRSSRGKSPSSRRKR